MTDERIDPRTQQGSSEAHYGGELVASFPEYLQAQALVDRMSNDGFPVERIRIVGDGVRTVEQVTGRKTIGRAALGAAGAGAWFGLLVGLLLGLFTFGPMAWLWVLLLSVVLGALWGAAFGALAHWSTGGERDFSSVMTLKAQRYDVLVEGEHAAEAARYRNE